MRDVLRRAAEALGAKIITERSETLATTTTDTSRIGWESRRRCRDATVQHVCRVGCYWIAEPVDEVMTSRIVLVAPEIALEWLKRNDENRSFTRGNARALAAEMQRGFWKENGESIVFDTHGVLIDGQHRLQAVLNSGYEYLVPVITGVQAEARPTVDTGTKRTAANNLQMADEPYASVLAATLLLWRGYEARNARQMTHPASGAPEDRVSIPRILEYLEEWPGLREAARESFALRPAGRGRQLIPTSEAAMVWFAIVQSGSSRDRANEFLGSVLSGYNLTEDSPIIALRRRLIDNIRPGLRMDKRERLALVLKTWLLWSTGQTRKVIVWSPPEPFPFLD